MPLSACGGDDDRTSSADSTAAAAPTTTPQDAPEGDAIVISVMGGREGTSAAPEVYDGAEAAAAAINAVGGVADPTGGPNRPIEILTCDALVQVDPNSAANCAREAVEAGVLASAGKLSTGPESVTALAEAGIPVVGPYVVLPDDYTNDLSFPLAGGPSVAGAGLGVLLQQQGAGSIGLLVTDTPAAPAVEAAVAGLLENGGEDLAVSLRIPADPSEDLAPIMAQVVNAEPGGVMILTDATKTGLAIKSLRQAGYEGSIAVSASSLTPEVVDDLGDMAVGIFGVSNFAAPTADDPVMAQFRAEMDAHAPDAFRTEFSIGSWMSVHLIVDALTDATSIDPEALVSALQDRPIADMGVPEFTLGTEGVSFLPYPRVPRATVQFQVLENGELRPLGDGAFIDLNEIANR